LLFSRDSGLSRTMQCPRAVKEGWAMRRDAARVSAWRCRCLAVFGSCRGINLTEVTVALGILGVAIAGTVRAVPTAYQTIFRAGDVTTAIALAQQRLEQLRNRPMADAALASGLALSRVLFRGRVRDEPGNSAAASADRS